MIQNIPPFKTQEELLQFAYANGLFKPNQFSQQTQENPIPAITPIEGSPVYNSATNSISLSADQLNPTNTVDDYWTSPELLERMSANRLANANISDYEAENGDVDPTNPMNYEKQSTQNGVPNFQFFNPYGSFGDTGVASFRLGQSIANKDTFGTVAGGLKVGAGIARNLMSGLGYAKQNEKIMEEYRKQQRNGMTGANRPVQYEEGGQHSEQQPNQEEMMLQEVATAIQAGEDPQQIIEALIGMGVDQQTAQGMVEFVMAQLQQEGSNQQPDPNAQQQQPQEEVPMMEQGGQFSEKLKDKKILNYTLNPKTNQYEVEYE